MSREGRTFPADRRRQMATAASFSRPDVGPLGWGWILFVLFLLFFPFSSSDGASAWKDVFPYAIHVGMWAGLVWSLWPLARGRARYQWWLLGLLVLAGGVSECIQGFVGRTPEWLDWGMDTIGAIVATLLGRGWRKAGWCVVAMLVMALLYFVGFRMAEEWCAYPILADPVCRWTRYRWECNGIRLRSGKTYLRAIYDRENPSLWPGMFRTPLCRDWSGTRGLELEVYWPRSNRGDGILGIRIDDDFNNPPYPERWQMEVPVSNGWNRLVLTNAWLHTPSGRVMESSRIRSWGVFVISAPKTNFFGLGKANLLVNFPSLL